MKRHDALNTIFNQYQPSFDDGDVFLSNLDDRLDVADYVRQFVTSERKKERVALVVAFLLGVVSGCLSVVLFVFAPLAPFVCVVSDNLFVSFVLSHLDVIVGIVFLLAMVFCVVFVVVAIHSVFVEVQSKRYPPSIRR